MRDAIIIGALYAAVGAIVAALAIKYASPSVLWDIVLWGGVALAIGCIASLWLSASHQTTGRPFLLPAACINLGLCLLVFGFVWHFSGFRQSSTYTYILSLSDLDIIIDEKNPNVDLAIGLKIKNTNENPTKYRPESVSVKFNDANGKTDPLTPIDFVIRGKDETLFNIHSISEIKKTATDLVNVVVEFVFLYGPADSTLIRRWSYGLKFSFNPQTLSHARYITEYERDEPK